MEKEMMPNAWLYLLEERKSPCGEDLLKGRQPKVRPPTNVWFIKGSTTTPVLYNY